jgi:exodeoxyribonuclease VII large subunit
MENETQTIYTPSMVNDYIKARLELDPELNNIWIEGEITQLKTYSLGKQVYFYISDGQSQLNCVMYSSALTRLKFEPKEGLKIKARGKINIFHKRGTYNFQVTFMMPEGDGALAQQFEALKAKLSAEGLFNPEHKKEIPAFPKKVAVITSPNSAAMVDFCKVMKTQAPQISVTVIPSVMQGQDSPPSVFHSINMAQMYQQFDVLVITRGGGSKEDLAAFNDEVLVRRSFDCPIPLISAIGHEIDFSLLDFVADKRAQTPTEAAQLLCTPTLQLKEKLSYLRTHFHTLIQSKLSKARESLERSFSDCGMALDILFEKRHTQLGQVKHRLGQANPLHKLERGFSICSKPDSGQLIKSITDISEGDLIRTRLKDGIILSKVEQRDKTNIS